MRLNKRLCIFQFLHQLTEGFLLIRRRSDLGQQSLDRFDMFAGLLQNAGYCL